MRLTAMALTTSYAVSCLLGIAINLSSSAGPAERLSISIEPARETFLSSQAVSIVITVRNNSNSAAGVYPSFSPQHSPNYPDTVLLFEVVGPDGKVIERGHSASELERRKRVAQADFREISPGWFFGGPIYINRPPFAYKLTEPGIYHIRAKAVFTAREWLQDRGQQNPGLTDQFSFASEFLEDGSRISNEITLEILPQARARPPGR